MKEIKVYSDNFSEDVLQSLIKILKKEGQTLEYYNWCAKRMGRVQKKYSMLRKWPGHIQAKYKYIVDLHERAERGVVLTA